MARNRVDIDIDAEEAAVELSEAGDDITNAASRAVRQLAVLAEDAMKEEAPEGRGRDQHMRDSIDTRFRTGGLQANIGARKRADDGTLLATYVVEGTDASSYDPDNPPPAEPLVEWADAKLGDPSLGYAIQQSIAQDGHETLPNRFVDRSLEAWEDQVEDIMGDFIRAALTGGGPS